MQIYYIDTLVKLVNLNLSKLEVIQNLIYFLKIKIKIINSTSVDKETHYAFI